MPRKTQEQQVTDLLFALSDRIRRRFDDIAADCDLTSSQAAALLHLDGAMSMCDLAAALVCDRSNVTGIVDRLEERGLAERHPDPDDRRVTRLVLTSAGKKIRARFHERLYAEFPDIRPLSDSELKTLGMLLRRMATG